MQGAVDGGATPLPAPAQGSQQHQQQPEDASTPAAWEQLKENFVPVRSGRRTAALHDVADPTASSTKHAIEARRR
jgi:hypothetical protein